MQIVIMAAGKGVRMGDYTAEGPKALLQVRGRYLGDYLLSSLNPFNPDHVMMVGGFHHDSLVKAIKPLHPEIEFVFNKDFEQGNLLSVMAAFENLRQDDLLILNADHLFSTAILKCFFSTQKQTFAMACDHDRPLGADDMKVAYSRPGHLREMSKALTSFDAGYIGATFVPRSLLSVYQETAKKVLQKWGPKTSAESVLNELASTGHDVSEIDASGSVWVEVDTPEDFSRAQGIIPSLGIPIA